MDYKIDFHAYWHCGSGQSAGADVDELVIKDRDGIPFVPGRTVKGILKDAMRTLVDMGQGDKAVLERVFGCEVTNNNNEDKDPNTRQGSAFFSDATLSRHEALAIATNHAQQHLYTKVASTAIDDDGIAVDGSLRKIEVTVPCTVYGTISGLSAEDESELERAMKYVKRMGLGRTRGWGRCTIAKSNNQE